MNQSETKPRVVTKNLEDIIKQSTFSTKRNSIDDLLQCHHNLNTQPKNKNPGEKHQRCKTNAFNKQSEQKNSLSMSKHSICSKEKITFNGIDEQKVKHLRINYSNNKNSNSQKKPNNKQIFEVDKLREKKSIPNTTNYYNQSLYFNHIDVIFTELEDFLRETRDTVLTVFNQQHHSQTQQSKNQMTQEMEELFSVFKEELQRLLKKYQNRKDLKQNNTKPKQGSLIKKSQSKQIGKQKSNFTNTKDQDKKNDCPTLPHQLDEIESYIQHQNILNSTILSDQQEKNNITYLSTETSTELLSMLALKKEFNNAKRKFQNPSLHVKQSKTRKQGSQGEYSFRNKQLFESVPEAQGKTTSIISTDKKRKIRKPSCESENKQNRQKSVYELVLQENRRNKIGACK